MFVEELNFISLGKLFQMVTARYKKLRWPIAVLQRGMSSLFGLRVESVAANRAPLDESGTKVGRCHTVHALKMVAFS